MKQMLYSLAILGYLLFVSGCATTSIGDRDHRDIPSLQGEMFPSNNPEEAPGEYEEPKGTITLVLPGRNNFPYTLRGLPV